MSGVSDKLSARKIGPDIDASESFHQKLARRVKAQETGFRWAVLGRGLPQYDLYLESLGIGLAIMLSGLWYFKRVERYFADLI